MGCPQSKFKRRQGQEHEVKEEKNETRPSHKVSELDSLEVLSNKLYPKELEFYCITQIL